MLTCGVLAFAGLMHGSRGGDLTGWGFWRALRPDSCLSVALMVDGDTSRDGRKWESGCLCITVLFAHGWAYH
ncbi:hypothetical protein HOY82DRAFT_564353 [Tuber indicum]|nr:hypothetical protein HOY82DRAFT_564353 [Tuber indicum]